MTSVSTRRHDRINSNQEERQRRGYEIRTGFAWAEVGGRPAVRRAGVTGREGVELADITYGQTATLTLINLGWARRKPGETGYLLDLDKGRWQSRPGDEDPDDPMSARVKRVIPFVDDRRNTLVFDPEVGLETEDRNRRMASLEAALKNAVQAVYDLEDSELAVASLPDRDTRAAILLYEASEGGAGVLRHITEDADALRRIARQALELCHFDPDTGDDLRRAPGANEDCEAACYDCLMSYTNQPDHLALDRKLIRQYLIDLVGATVATSPSGLSRDEHLQMLINLSQSDLERSWLKVVHDHNFRLPEAAQALLPHVGSRPDFTYEAARVVVYVDGPHHKYPERQGRDAHLDDKLLPAGWTCVRFRVDDIEGWIEGIRKNPSTFGTGQ